MAKEIHRKGVKVLTAGESVNCAYSLDEEELNLIIEYCRHQNNHKASENT